MMTLLPIMPVLPRLLKALRAGSAILSAPTGSGKTTMVPLALLEEEWLAGRKIVMLEPRRIAARAAAARMSDLLGEKVGKTVGYRIRFDSRVSAETRIEVVTEGILTRRLQSDPELAGVGIVIFDEFHERSMHADLGLALCLDLCELRDDLRLLVMSATLEADALSKLMNDAPIIIGEGKSFPVTIHHLPLPLTPRDIISNMVKGIRHAGAETEGDILAFLPGTGEIRAVALQLADILPNSDILPLYGELGYAEQDRVLKPSRHNKRRIILSTPIAETSVTIEGITCVVDGGLARRPQFNPSTGLTRLETVRISQASAAQRSGRAGRLSPGHCYRLWSKETDRDLLPQTPPEIVTGDPASLVLELAIWGVTDPNRLKWLDPPRRGAWDGAVELLRWLGALDDRGHATAFGRQMARLPVHPRLATMLLAAQDRGVGNTACAVAALLSERDLFKGRGRSSDLRERLTALNGTRQTGGNETDPLIRRRLLHQIEQMKNLLGLDAAESVHPDAVGALLAFAYPDRVAILRQDSRTRYQLNTGKGAVLADDDPLAGNTLLVVPQLDAGRENAKIRVAVPVPESDLRRDHPHLFGSRERIWWDDTAGRVQAMQETMLGKVLLSGTPILSPNPERVLSTLLAGLREAGPKALPWTAEARQLQARVCSLRHWQGNHWPDLADDHLFSDLTWLAPYCAGLTKIAEIERLDLSVILRSLLPWELQQQLEKDAPPHIIVPSGSRKPLRYQPGEPPVLAVRLQEMFGLTTNPAVCGGRITVTLHLLSPSNRPVQVTSDLESFWKTGYIQVKKELAGRYPKHYWPDDPSKAPPTSGTKRSMQRQHPAGSPGAVPKKK